MFFFTSSISRINSSLSNDILLMSVIRFDSSPSLSAGGKQRLTCWVYADLDLEENVLGQYGHFIDDILNILFSFFEL